MATPKDTYHQWLLNLSWKEVLKALGNLGAERLWIKKLADNQDNSKNQIYFGDVDLVMIGVRLTAKPEVRPGTSRKPRGDGTVFHIPVSWSWLAPGFRPVLAPNTKIVFHPQYPESRLSGFLSKCSDPPRWLLDRDTQEPGRILVFTSVGPDMYGLVLPAESKAVPELLKDFDAGVPVGPFRMVSTDPGNPEPTSKGELLELLREVHERGWLRPVRLHQNGTFVPCNGTNCGGYTLEAHLGIKPNGKAEPDYGGWELKAHRRSKLGGSTISGRLTLMTPEPDGGAYQESGADAFVLKWGYQTKPDRFDFAGTQRVGSPLHPKTNTTLVLSGYRGVGDWDPSGALQLVDAVGVVAASWSFAKILEHWSHKHAQTAYVPYLRRDEPPGFSYGPDCWIGEGGTMDHFMSALARGKIFYDPGIHIDKTASGWKAKKRSQFRALGKDLPDLYRTFDHCEM